MTERCGKSFEWIFQLLSGLLAAGSIAAFAGAASAESDSERAFRERRSDILRSQDPDRVKIDRPSSPAVPKIEGIGEGDLDDTGKPPNATSIRQRQRDHSGG